MEATVDPTAEAGFDLAAELAATMWNAFALVQRGWQRRILELRESCIVEMDGCFMQVVDSYSMALLEKLTVSVASPECVRLVFCTSHASALGQWSNTPPTSVVCTFRFEVSEDVAEFVSCVQSHPATGRNTPAGSTQYTRGKFEIQVADNDSGSDENNANNKSSNNNNNNDAVLAATSTGQQVNNGAPAVATKRTNILSVWESEADAARGGGGKLVAKSDGKFMSSVVHTVACVGRDSVGEEYSVVVAGETLTLVPDDVRVKAVPISFSLAQISQLIVGPFRQYLRISLATQPLSKPSSLAANASSSATQTVLVLGPSIGQIEKLLECLAVNSALAYGHDSSVLLRLNKAVTSPPFQALEAFVLLRAWELATASSGTRKRELFGLVVWGDISHVVQIGLPELEFTSVAALSRSGISSAKGEERDGVLVCERGCSVVQGGDVQSSGHGANCWRLSLMSSDDRSAILQTLQQWIA
eukprot:c45770_g1_i1.p1 GENE.c45770_g1_i1~~c45770_g1_i1.p1  ORF type:complete len:473 (-),score=122.78 c45770_g1_i1:39-1457(-)